MCATAAATMATTPTATIPQPGDGGERSRSLHRLADEAKIVQRAVTERWIALDRRRDGVV